MENPQKIFSFVFLFFSLQFFSQLPVNGFANVTAISGTLVSVNNVSELYDTFEDGELIIIMQMQDNVIGTNTANASTFGNLGSIQSAGLYEIAQIVSHTESILVPTSFTLLNPLVNTYNINSNASVQIISFRSLGTNFTTIAPIGTLPWNGTIGGVTAITVSGVLTLGHSISANGCGFAGGNKNTPNGYSACDNSTYATALAQLYAGKGTGIYKSTTAGFGGARGKILNAGGGGNDVNGGGGGGGNFTSGGSGGSGWTPSGVGCSPIVGGLGGISLSSQIAGNRVFMGGGGGSGQENDGVGTVGAAGGGIIFIKTGTLQTVACSGISISANGSAAGAALNDGAGGGGAGGTIVFNSGTFSVVSACALTVSANGGNGGSSNASSSGAHGGGGGGGQGALIYTSSQPTVNVVSTTAPGTGGVSCSGCGSSVNGSVGSGTSNSGIITMGSTPLPVELIRFKAYADAQNHVALEWATAVEVNSNKFVIQRMNEDTKIVELGELKTKGNNSQYGFTDLAPAKGVNYYRLKQVDNDGKVSLKSWAEVNLTEEREEQITIYPNPLQAGDPLFVRYTGENAKDMQLELMSMTSGLTLLPTLSETNATIFSYKLSDISAGIYSVKIHINGTVFYKKLLILK